MNEREIEKAKFITEYLFNNYYNDSRRMLGIPIISALVNHAKLDEIPSLIDKIAILSGIEKSYKSKEIVINA